MKGHGCCSREAGELDGWGGSPVLDYDDYEALFNTGDDAALRRISSSARSNGGNPSKVASW
jgi:hypothetical protein